MPLEGFVHSFLHLFGLTNEKKDIKAAGKPVRTKWQPQCVVPSHVLRAECKAEENPNRHCKVAVVFESHTLPEPSAALSKLMHNHQFTYLAEEPKGRSLEKTLEVFLKFESLNKGVVNNYNCRTLTAENYDLCTAVSTNQANLMLYNTLKALKVPYKAIDLSARDRAKCQSENSKPECWEKRDGNFVKNIEQACQHDDRIVFLVGHEHEGVVTALHEKGYQVNGFILYAMLIETCEMSPSRLSEQRQVSTSFGHKQVERFESLVKICEIIKANTGIFNTVCHPNSSSNDCVEAAVKALGDFFTAQGDA
jgi:hypothetical protein